MVGILVSFWDGLCSGAMLILAPWKLTEELKTHHLKMYFLLKMVIFRPVMLVFRCTRRSFMPWNPTKKIPFSPSLPEDVFPGQWNDEGEDNIHKLGFSQSIRCCCSVRSTRCTYSKKSKAFFRALRWRNPFLIHKHGWKFHYFWLFVVVPVEEGICEPMAMF